MSNNFCKQTLAPNRVYVPLKYVKKYEHNKN